MRLRRRKKGEKVADMFPGQSSQAPGMAGGVSKETLGELRERAQSVLLERITTPIFDLISPSALELPPDQQQKMMAELVETEKAQLAVFITSYGHWLDISRVEDFRMPDFMLGHSLGECTAICASGAMTFEDTLKFVYCRSIAMGVATVLKKGGMRAVLGDIKKDKIDKCLRGTGVEIANYNTPRQVVISGGVDGLLLAALKLKVKGYRVVNVRVAGAFHNSGYMGCIKEKLESDIKEYGITIRAPAVPIICNFTGRPTKDPKRLISHLVDQPGNTVLWQDSIEFLVKEGVPKHLFEEIGYGKVLTNFLLDFPKLVKSENANKNSE